MDDIRVMAAVFVAIAAMGVHMQMTPAKIVPGKNPAEKLVTQAQQRNREQRAKEAAIARGEGAITGTKKDAAQKAKDRAAGGVIDDSTEKALNELESHGDAVQKKLSELPFAGGGGDDSSEEEDEK